MRLSDEQVIGRVELGHSWLTRFRRNDVYASNRYIDAASANVGTDSLPTGEGTFEFFQEEADVPAAQPVGQINYLAINTEQKIAAIAMSMPTLHVVANEDPKGDGMPGASKIVAAAWEDAWTLNDWGRECQAVIQKTGICGLGCLWYRWDQRRGPAFEAVSSANYFFNPHARTFADLGWAGVRVCMSLREAMERYPKKADELSVEDDPLSDPEDESPDREVREVDIYFDGEEEIHVRKGEILLRTPNLYRTLPFVWLQAFIDPRDKLLPLGDNVVASGLNQLVVDLTTQLSNAIKHGGSILLVDQNRVEDEGQRAALESGLQQQILMLNGPVSPPPLERLPAEQVSPGWRDARQEAQAALDGIQGVPSASRGTLQENVSATQAAMVLSRAGARPMKTLADYENFVTKMVKAFVRMCQEFGGPDEREKRPNKDSVRIWSAFKRVYNVRVLPGSTSYNDPARDQQVAMQLYREVVQSLPAWQQLATHGSVTKFPNMVQYTDDMLRAFARQNTELYWTNLPPPMPPQYSLPPQLERAFSAIYAKAPPDVKRQIEQALGMKPSQGEEPEQQAPDHAPEEIGAKLHMQAADHAHDLHMKLLEMAEKMDSGGSAPVDRNGQ